MAWWLSVLLLAAWILLAAKAHGRQVRLEREQQGVFHVEFGGRNPEAVERVWATDRRVFWPAFAALALGTLALAALAWAVLGSAPDVAVDLSVAPPLHAAKRNGKAAARKR